mmetsp:Transcript_18140/g.51774  ORF Transcript_18140/g.51774 Transcript_18140/m.51774 type:complete len:260 (-) Transcript_18140:42-821(-)
MAAPEISSRSPAPIFHPDSNLGAHPQRILDGTMRACALTTKSAAIRPGDGIHAGHHLVHRAAVPDRKDHSVGNPAVQHPAEIGVYGALPSHLCAHVAAMTTLERKLVRCEDTVGMPVVDLRYADPHVVRFHVMRDIPRGHEVSGIRHRSRSVPRQLRQRVLVRRVAAENENCNGQEEHTTNVHGKEAGRHRTLKFDASTVCAIHTNHALLRVAERLHHWVRVLRERGVPVVQRHRRKKLRRPHFMHLHICRQAYRHDDQ